MRYIRLRELRTAMLLVHGAYHFWPKRVAFRDDYCLTCRARRRSIAIRTFDVGHIFWIPILPVGFWKHWKCTFCGRDPHVSPWTRRSFKWIGLAILIMVSIAFWVVPVDADSLALDWIFRLAGPAGALMLLLHLLRSPKVPSWRERLAAIPPAADIVCPFCATPLVASASGRWTCPACATARY